RRSGAQFFGTSNNLRSSAAYHLSRRMSAASSHRASSSRFISPLDFPFVTCSQKYSSMSLYSSSRSHPTRMLSKHLNQLIGNSYKTSVLYVVALTGIPAGHRRRARLYMLEQGPRLFNALWVKI